MDGGGSRQLEDAARKRVAVEMLAKHERTLRRTARRYSICTEDAEDAFQRALEILMLKSPPGEARELIRWMQTVTKHEALAVRRARERQLTPAPLAASEYDDWLELFPSQSPGPAERAERRESLAHSREALQSLKPAELRALTLLAEGYSYLEIGEITGYSRTKINRCLAEGREAFRALSARSESGERCTELRPMLSAFCDGEASPKQVTVVREHLRACAHCRATMRAYRAAPGAVAALLPAPLAARTLFERAHDAIAGLGARLTEQRLGAESAISQVAASGGGRGPGMAVLAKALAICAGTAGGAAACVSAGVVPPLLDPAADRAVSPRVVRIAPPRPPQAAEEAPPSAEPSEPAPPEPTAEPAPQPSEEPVAVEAAIEPVSTPSPSPPPAQSAPAAAAPPPQAAGEFGP